MTDTTPQIDPGPLMTAGHRAALRAVRDVELSWRVPMSPVEFAETEIWVPMERGANRFSFGCAHG